MKTRIITSVVGLCFLALVLSMFNTIVLDLVVAALCLLGIHEAFAAFGFKTGQLYLYAPFVPFTILVMLSHGSAARAALLPAAFVFMLYLCVCVIIKHRTVDVAKLSGFVCLSGLMMLCFYSLVELKRLLPYEIYHYDAVFFVLLALCYAWGGDSAAYFTGRFLGKHKLAPEVSPHKTVEGALGGLAGGMAGMAVFCAVFRAMTHTALSYSLCIALGLLGAVLGELGDLSFSAVKRQYGIKDYGRLLPGHGGVLDRFDSVLFAAPVLCALLRALAA